MLVIGVALAVYASADQAGSSEIAKKALKSIQLTQDDVDQLTTQGTWLIKMSVPVDTTLGSQTGTATELGQVFALCSVVPGRYPVVDVPDGKAGRRRWSTGSLRRNAIDARLLQCLPGMELMRPDCCDRLAGEVRARVGARVLPVYMTTEAPRV